MAEAEAYADVRAVVRDVVAERLVLLTTYGVPGLGSPDAAVIALVPYDRRAACSSATPG